MVERWTLSEGKVEGRENPRYRSGYKVDKMAPGWKMPAESDKVNAVYNHGWSNDSEGNNY